MDDLLLYKFLQNEASEDEIRTVLDWLDADPANRKYFDGLDNMLNAARVNRPAGRRGLSSAGLLPNRHHFVVDIRVPFCYHGLIKK